MAAFDRQYAVINTYPTAPSAGNIGLIYSLYSDYPNSRLATDSNAVTEPATPYTLYAYDWSISPTG
jgi:hypothetical protein